MPERILLVSPASPFAPKSGAQQRTALLYEALQRLSEVDVLLLEPTADESRLATAADGIFAHGLWHARPMGIGKFQPDDALNRMLQVKGLDLEAYTLIVSRYLNPLSKLNIPPGVRTIVDLDDWGYHYPTTGFNLTARIKSAYALWLATRQLPRFDAFFFVSARDQARHPGLRSSILPNIPFNPPARPFAQTDSKTLLFVGSLWYGPNRQGVDRFLRHCWPAIKEAVPDAQLLLAGAVSPSVRRNWETYPGVSAPGFVDDLAEAYRNAAFTIAPIYAGGGTNIKILESLAYGRACVTTPSSAAGFQSGLAGAGMAIAQTDAHFARQCIGWLNDVSSRKNEADHGYAQLQAHYTRDLFFERVAGLSGIPLRTDSGTS